MFIDLIIACDDIFDKLGSLHASQTVFVFNNDRFQGEDFVSKINLRPLMASVRSVSSEIFLAL